ncbi:SHOCT domain-containing protein [Mycobacterium sp. NPDC050853]|uniref:SHOCT domain-containing protein n=1 Tax=Mycobacterium sp. NPDC050853 TaxID=3155160 RepID=UPI003403C59D
MDINEIAPTATQFLADQADRWGDHPWHPWFLVFPILFWTLVIVAIVSARRRWAGRQGEGTLRDVYARGEITEAEYRDRLTMLRGTRR